MLSRNTLLWINRVVWTLLVGVVILLGSIVSAGRYLIPDIASHQQEIVAEIHRRTGLQISVGHLGGSWKRLSPHFVVDDFRLHDPRDASRVVLQIAHAEIQLGLFRSIASGTVAISRLRGHGVHVEMEEAELGKWRLAGFGGEGNMRADRVVDFLAAIYRAQLDDSTIDLHFFGGGDTRLTGRALSLQRSGEFRRLNLDVKFSADTNDHSEPLRIVFETQGDPRLADQFSIKGFGQFSSVDLTPVLPAAKAFGVNLEHGRVDGAAWFEWRANGIMELRGRAEIPQLDLAGISRLELEPIKNIKTQFLIRNFPGAGHTRKRQFWLPELSGHWHGVELKFPQLGATIQSAQPQRVLIAMPQLALSPMLEAALADKNLSVHLRDVLTTLSPQGVLRNLIIDLPLRADQFDTWRLSAQMQNVAVQPWHGAPGATNVSGLIEMGAHGGRVDLLSENFSMAFPQVYREPLHFDTTRGQIHWRIEDERVLVDSGPIVTRSDAGLATAQVSLDLPFGAGATPLMTLQVGLQNSAAQFRHRFIPYTLSPSLLQWLQQSIGRGDVPIGGFIYRGSLLGNDHLNNTVQLFLRADNAELAYQPEWPPLHDIRADVWVDDTQLRVDAKSARMYRRIALRDAEVNLQHDGGVSWLTVEASAEAGDDEVLRLLRETPIRGQIGPALDRWRWHGPVRSRVHLGLAISGAREQEIDVESHLDGGVLDMLDQNIVLDDVRGVLNFRSERHGTAAAGKPGGLSADAVQAKWFGKPITIDVATAPEGANDEGAIDVGARGHIAMTDLKQWLQQPLFDFASGEVPFASTLRIANGTASVNVESNLQGAVIDLPAPYHKTAEQHLPLALTMDLGAEPNLTATLGDWMDMQLRWDRDDTGVMQPDAGLLRLGQQGKSTLHSGQFIITGAVSSTNLSDWSAASRAHPSALASETAADNDNRLAVQVRELHFDSAQVGAQTLQSLTLSGRRDSAAWNVQMRAEQIAGTLLIPDDAQRPLYAQLNYLRLPASATAPARHSEENDPAPENAADDSPLAHTDPREVPAIDLHIDQLWYGDENLGWVETQMRPHENGLRLDHLTGQLRTVKIEAHGQQPAQLNWVRDGENHRTQFVGRLAVDDIAHALQRWRYEPVLTSSQGYADVEFQWPGRPDQFKFVQTEGQAALRFDEGQFKRASNSATGALKVVGIFNFANFLRRLQFDFSDIYKEGLSFDEMQGSFNTRDGILVIDQPVEIKSPSSRFRLAGQIDFNTDQADMELAATLPVASNLPWVAVLTGALPVAAGLYVASRIFEDQLDKFSSAIYEVKGSWADPQVKLKRVFDDQLPRKNEALKKNGDSAKDRQDAASASTSETPAAEAAQ